MKWELNGSRGSSGLERCCAYSARRAAWLRLIAQDGAPKQKPEWRRRHEEFQEALRQSKLVSKVRAPQRAS